MAWPVLAASVALSIANAGVQYYIARQRREEDDEPDRFSTGSIPVVEEGTPIPVVFGTVRLRAPNIVWWRIAGVPGQTLRRWVTFHAIWCAGPVDSIEGIFLGDRRIAELDGTDEPTIDSWDLTSGQVDIEDAASYGEVSFLDSEGAVIGSTFVKRSDFPFIQIGQLQPGLPSQSRASRLTEFQGATGPAYRSVLGTVITLEMPFSVTRIPDMSMVVKRQASTSFGATQWYPAKAAVGQGLNPAHIIREAITDTQWGLGKPASIIDDDSFEAVADTLEAEGFGLSLLWDRRIAASRLIVEVLRHTDCAIYDEPTTGLVTLKLIRDDYNTATIPTIGPADIIGSPSSSRAAPSELVNEIVVTHSTNEADRERSIQVSDPVRQSIASPVTHRVNYPMIIDEDLAATVATRDLQQLSLPLRQVSMVVPPSVAEDLRPGSPFTFSYPDWGIESTVLRVVEMSMSTPDSADAAVRLLCLQDVFAFDQTIVIPPPALDIPEEDPPPNPVRMALEMPLWMAYRHRQQFIDGSTTLEQLLPFESGQAGLLIDSDDDTAIAWDLYTQGQLRYEVLPLSPRIEIGGFTSTVNVESVAVTFSTDRPLTPDAGEWILVYLPNVDDELTGLAKFAGAKPNIAAIRDYDLNAGTGTLELGLFDTAPPVLFRTSHTDNAWVMGYITWGDAPQIRFTMGIDQTLWPEGMDVALSAVLRTVTEVGNPEAAQEEEVTIASRAFLPYSPGRARIDASADGVDRSDTSGEIVITGRERDRAGAQKTQSVDTAVVPDEAHTYTVTIFNFEPALAKITLLRNVLSLSTPSYTYTGLDEADDMVDAGFDRELAEFLVCFWTSRRDGSIISEWPTSVVLDRS